MIQQGGLAVASRRQVPATMPEFRDRDVILGRQNGGVEALTDRRQLSLELKRGRLQTPLGSFSAPLPGLPPTSAQTSGMPSR